MWDHENRQQIDFECLPPVLIPTMEHRRDEYNIYFKGCDGYLYVLEVSSKCSIVIYKIEKKN